MRSELANSNAPPSRERGAGSTTVRSSVRPPSMGNRSRPGRSCHTALPACGAASPGGAEPWLSCWERHCTCVPANPTPLRQWPFLSTTHIRTPQGPWLPAPPPPGLSHGGQATTSGLGKLRPLGVFAEPLVGACCPQRDGSTFLVTLAGSDVLEGFRVTGRAHGSILRRKNPLSQQTTRCPHREAHTRRK